MRRNILSRTKCKLMKNVVLIKLLFIFVDQNGYSKKVQLFFRPYISNTKI